MVRRGVLPLRASRTTAVLLQARDAQHDRPLAERLGQDLVVTRQPGEPLGQIRAHARNELRQAAGREPIHLGHHEIDPDRRRPASASRVTSRASQVRGHGHCPWRRRLSSSIATMTAGAERRIRGAHR